MAKLSDRTKQTIFREFSRRVNMSPGELRRWLKTAASRRVGAKGRRGGESTGHASGRRILAIRRKPKDELTAADYRHMKKVIGYIKRHRAQRPTTSIKDSAWRYSLMNWGHDPLKRTRRRRPGRHK